MVYDLDSFEGFVDVMWKEVLDSDYCSEVLSSGILNDKLISAIYLTQVYHYAVHTPRHQALVGVNRDNEDFKYMQYCFEHAFEETGHELMAIKDINSLGYQVNPSSMPPRLPATDLLISFLYKEAMSENPVHHLGYGFWSENACPFISEFMSNLMELSGLSRSQLTFYSSHVTIDEEHAVEVRNIVRKVAKTKEDWLGMSRVASITFNLTIQIARETIEVYKELIAGKANAFSPLILKSED